LTVFARTNPLCARGVTHAALFGSQARGDARPDSDTDIMIELDPEAAISLFDYAGLKDYIASLFDGPVDVVCRDNLKSYIRPFAAAERRLCLLGPPKPTFSIFAITSRLRANGLPGWITQHIVMICKSTLPSHVALRSYPRRHGAGPMISRPGIPPFHGEPLLAPATSTAPNMRTCPSVRYGSPSHAICRLCWR
jgi:predicted nucleotidyltransferase